MSEQQQHGLEPWSLVHSHFHAFPMIYDAVGCAVGSEVENENKRLAANGRRIVACVNACAGIPTDLLETARLAAIHVELLEAAEAALDWIAPHGGDSDEQRETYEQLLTAIQRSKGQGGA